MAKVKEVKIDGESIYIFNSAIYIVESSNGYTLELDVIVSENVVNKYKQEDTLIVEIELEDGRLLDSYMHLKSLPGGLPQLNLFCELDDIKEYEDFLIVNENESAFPNIEEGITLEEIRKYEMPYEKITLKVSLPIEQTEWLREQKTKQQAEIIREAIYDYWKKHQIKK